MAFTDPRTGITSYKDPAATDQTAAQAPSTATSLPAPKTAPTGMLPTFFSPTGSVAPGLVKASRYDAKDADRHWYGLNPQTGQYEWVYGVADYGPSTDYLPNFSGYSDATGYSEYSDAQKAGPEYSDAFHATNPLAHGPQTTYYLASDPNRPQTGGGWAEDPYMGGLNLLDIGSLAALGIITGGAAGAAVGGGAVGAAAGGAASGAEGALISEQDPLKGALLGAATGGTAGALAPGVSSYLGGGMLGAAGAGALTGGIGALTRGGGLNEIARGAALGGVTSGGARGVADTLFADTPTAAPAVADATLADATRRRGMLPTSFFEPTASQVPGASIDAFGRTASPTDLAGTQTGSAVPAQFNGDINSLIQAAGLAPSASPTSIGREQGAETPQAPSKAPGADNAQNVERIAKLGQALYKQLGAPHDAPQRAKGQSDADYGNSLAQYAAQTGGFDAASLQGLTPGTPQYYQAVMGQMDSVIQRLSSGLNLDSADLEAQLHGKSEKELEALDRALYVRGQLGQLMGSGTYTDPFSGRSQDINTNGMLVNPARAAYQQGLAQSAGDIAAQTPGEGEQTLRSLFARSPDLYGAEAARQARIQDEMLAAQNLPAYDTKKRRGMLADYPQFDGAL